jgi:hypothetical protein
MTNATRILARGLLPLLLCLSLALAFGSAGGATITIVNIDGVDEGFNDPTPVSPVGGNPATTLGAQRLYIFQYAANLWGSKICSTVQIQVYAQFNPLQCDSASAVLGSTSTSSVRNFTGAPYTATWYPQSLANSLVGSDLAVGTADMTISFNSTLDGGTCLGHTVWYYGTDGNEGANVELLPVILHELTHGLGFMTTTNGSTGIYSSSSPHIYDYFLHDNTTGLRWNQETSAQRRASAIAGSKLAWGGSNVLTYAPTFLAKRPELLVNVPAGIAGEYSMVGAVFGATVTAGGVTADVVLVNDGAGTSTSDACEQPFVNAADVAGKWALLDRGTCTFVVKAQAAQAAGAVGVIVGNNAAGLPPNPMGGSDPTIVIPVVGISQADANTIKANLATGVNVTVKLHPTALTGVDAAGRPLMYTPNPFASGSSVSHWDVTVAPNALMEPFINNDLHDAVDMSLPLLHDIGWVVGWPTATTLARFAAEGRSDGVLLRWQFGDPGDVSVITVQRAPAETGPWASITTELGQDGDATLALDTQAEPGITYYYRLSVLDVFGETTNLGLVSAQRATPLTAGVTFGAPTPNPSAHGVSLQLRISQPEYVRLSVLDASGRVVRKLHEGMLSPGEHSLSWDGRSSGSELVPAGVYFFSLHTSAGVQTRRVAIVR